MRTTRFDSSPTWQALIVVVVVLPPQLADLDRGQSSAFKAKTREYYQELKDEGVIDPRTVTKDQFVRDAIPLAERQGDAAALAWVKTASKLLQASYDAVRKDDKAREASNQKQHQQDQKARKHQRDLDRVLQWDAYTSRAQSEAALRAPSANSGTASDMQGHRVMSRDEFLLDLRSQHRV